MFSSVSCFVFTPQTLDGEVFERLKDYFSVFSTTEIEASTYSMTCFNKVLANALKVSVNTVVAFLEQMGGD